MNTQLPRFASWKPDPESEFIDAFSFQWKTEFCYLFPTFSLISRCVQKIVREEAEVLIIVPLWPTQIWYTQLLQLLIDFPRVLPQRNKLLWIPQTEKIHPLEKQMRLIACHLSGKISKTKEFHLKLFRYCGICCFSVRYWSCSDSAVFVVFLLDIGAVPTVWYLLFFC